MDYAAFIARVCADGLDASARDYAKPEDADRREGAAQGFMEAGSTTSPAELGELLARANDDWNDAFFRQDERYWFWRCRVAEIEWTANVLSAALLDRGLPVIIPPTYRGIMKAAEILGVSA